MKVLKKLKIGNFELENNVIVAPMAGITDLTFRTICKEFGAGLVTTEMISAKGLYYKDKKTESLMKINETNRPVSMQIFGSDPDTMAFVVENYLNQRSSFDILDINMGCPAPKIVKNGDGSALMKSPLLAGRIIEKVKKVSLKPVTVKFRSGWDQNSINAVEFAKIAEQSGADAIAVHGRHREQFYSGKADYDVIKSVKESVKIPVIGNGDIFEASDAIRMIDYTNCDGVMVARGVMGNPWLIRNVVNIQRGLEIYSPSPDDRINMLKRHAAELVKELPEKLAILEMRKHASWYIKGLKKSSEMRNKINKVQTLGELYDIFINILIL